MHVDDLAYSQLSDQILVKALLFQTYMCFSEENNFKHNVLWLYYTSEGKEFSDFHCFQKLSDDFNFENSQNI